jgi:uncharacterized membrane protein YdfJ with MMPL/SSD domain
MAINPEIGRTQLISKTMHSAGRTVIISSLTIALSLSTLLLIPIPFIRSLGMGGVLVPISSALVTLTLMPALLAIAGDRISKSYKFAGVPGRGGGFSLETPEGLRFLIRSRLFSDQETAELDGQPLLLGSGERKLVLR